MLLYTHEPKIAELDGVQALMGSASETTSLCFLVLRPASRQVAPACISRWAVAYRWVQVSDQGNRDTAF